MMVTCETRIHRSWARLLEGLDEFRNNDDVVGIR